ncbi:MAG: hypothetical protein Q7S06_01920 [Nanoarchaeota archaeon]|nr:hypothetical protein [Nanoarchaeota archaeon]
MALDEAISMEPVKAKLKNLREHMKGEYETLYRFASYLADELNPELVPEGFNLTCELSLENLRRGGDYGKEGRVAVPSNLVGYPQVIYSFLRMRIPDVAKAVCPPDFAERVIAIYEEVQRMVKEQR